jgi:nitrous oxide reductase accessory protein NosL
LFEFLEEGFNEPTATIQVGDGLGVPFKVVGQENHFAELAIHPDERRNAARFGVKTLRYAVWQHGAAADELQARRANRVVEDLVNELGNAR